MVAGSASAGADGGVATGAWVGPFPSVSGRLSWSAMPRYDRLVVLTGAGISAESGLQTFRDKDGLWSKVRIEDVATPDAFRRDPTRVHAFYNARRAQLADPAIRPNAAHHALVRLEAARPEGFLLVTQNVDDLHARAGSRRMLAMHGQL